jgi:ParB-like chromosome segregation protein Spo0J
MNLPVHPAAELLPRLSDAELADLSRDIRDHGQRDAVVIWIDAAGKRWILDGRHRLAACKRAGIEPRIVEATAAQISDPAAFVLSKNVMRRNLTPAQRAVAIVALQGDKNLSARELAKRSGVNRDYLAKAAAIVAHDDNLAKDVLEGEVSISDAYRRTTKPENAGATRSASAPARSRDLAPAPAPQKAPAPDDKDLAHARRRVETAADLAYDAGLRPADLVAIVQSVWRRRR